MDKDIDNVTDTCISIYQLLLYTNNFFVRPVNTLQYYCNVIMFFVTQQLIYDFFFIQETFCGSLRSDKQHLNTHNSGRVATKARGIKWNTRHLNN